jgi:hypothetical protein
MLKQGREEKRHHYIYALRESFQWTNQKDIEVEGPTTTSRGVDQREGDGRERKKKCGAHTKAHLLLVPLN